MDIGKIPIEKLWGYIMRYPKEYQAQERIETRKDLQLIEKMMKVNFAFLCAGFILMQVIGLLIN